MKAKNLKRIETLTAALLLTLLLGCGPSKPTEAENKEAFAEATAAAAASETSAPPAAPVAPATPAAESAATPAAATAAVVRYEAMPTGSLMTMEGDSTMHKWNMKSTIIGGFLEAEAGFPASSSKATAQVFTPVRSYKSSGGKKMVQVMQDRMKEPKLTMF
jgi:hypothetical protein